MARRRTADARVAGPESALLLFPPSRGLVRLSPEPVEDREEIDGFGHKLRIGRDVCREQAMHGELIGTSPPMPFDPVVSAVVIP